MRWFQYFSANRPLIRDPLNRVQTDSAGNDYSLMHEYTSYFDVYSFWTADSAVWQSPYYKFWYEAEKELEVLIMVVKSDGTLDMLDGRGFFQLPEINDPTVVSINLALNNNQPDEHVKVYEWGLIKVNEPPKENLTPGENNGENLPTPE